MPRAREAVNKHAGRHDGSERIPAVDPAAEYAGLKAEIDAAVEGVLASGRYIGGPEVEGLEREFAAFCGVAHAVAVNSGTDALRFALMAAGTVTAGMDPVSAGAERPEVITSPLTFIATTEAISQAGARPVSVRNRPEGRQTSSKARPSTPGRQSRRLCWSVGPPQGRPVKRSQRLHRMDSNVHPAHDMMQRAMTWGLQHRPWKALRVIGIGEVSHRKGSFSLRGNLLDVDPSSYIAWGLP